MKNRRVFELRLGKVGLILFISGMSLLLFSVFLLGIIVGKQMETYPERYSSGIPELIRDSLLAAVSKQGKGAPSVVDPEKQEDPVSGGADFGLTFYDTLGGKKGGAVAGATAGSARHKVSEETPSSTAPPGVIKRETVPPAPGGDAGAKKLNPSPEGMPVEETGMQKPPAGETGLPGKGSFEVQLAAYRERSQAEQLVKKFAGSGFAPRVVMKDLPGKGRWFRVIAGGFESRQTAQEAAEQMAGKVRGLKCVVRSSGREGNGG
ncbi:MAG: SPOR domain-containing protein [Syntrophales bacterium]